MTVLLIRAKTVARASILLGNISVSAKISLRLVTDFVQCKEITVIGMLQGPNCDVDVDECLMYQGTASGCQNGGTCVNTRGSFT